MTRLTRISIHGFRSIQSANVELKPLNVFIGANGAGKSNLIAFLSLFKSAMTGGLQHFVQTRGPASAMLHFGPKISPEMRAVIVSETDDHRSEYGCTLAYAQGDTLIFTNEEVGTTPKVVSLGSGGNRESGLSEVWQNPRLAVELPSSESAGRESRLLGAWARDKSTLILLRQCRVYQFQDTSLESYLRRNAPADDTGYLRDNGGNLSSFLFRLRNEYPGEFRQIESTLNTALPWFKDFALEPQGLAPNQTIPLRWRTTDRPDYDFSVSQLSDGSLRLMCLVTLLLQPENLRPKLILLDEPELGLHPAAESLVAGLIKAASNSSQILVSTQSATFLDHFSADDIVVAENDQGRSTFTRQSSEALQSWLERYSLGQVWLKNIIGGRP